MYTQSDVRGIVGAFRSQYEPKPLNTLQDVKRHPNDILFNYLIADEGLNEESIRDNLSDLDELFQLLEVVAEVYGPGEDRPRLQDGITYDDGSLAVAVSIERKTGKFAFGSEDMLLAANTRPTTHTFPNEYSVPYYLLVDEEPADVSFLDMGFGTPESGQVYVRKQFLGAMRALLSVYEENGTFVSHADYFDEVREQMPGFVYGHEVNENQLISWGMAPEDIVVKELTSEGLSRDWLARLGVSEGAYALFHLVKGGPETEEIYDISRIIVNQDFRPLP